MVRTQVRLSEAQSRKLRAAARRDGISLAEAIRRLVARGLAEAETDRAQRYERGARAVGKFRDRRGARDVATRHDASLEEAFEWPGPHRDPRPTATSTTRASPR